MTAFVTLAEVERALLHDKPRRRIIIPDVLPAGPCLLYGPSGAGKTGIAVRTAATVAADLQWAGKSVNQGSVLYVAGEDIEGAKIRLVAAARDLDLQPAALPVGIMEAPPEGLGTNAARLAVLAAAKDLKEEWGHPVVLIIVDTLAASFGPKSQDDASAASEYMSSADKIARKMECAFLIVHHTGKDQRNGMRGSQVFFDRADAIIRVGKGKLGTTFGKVEKMRNGPGGARFSFDIAGINVETAGGIISGQVVRNLNACEPVEPESREAGKDRREQTDAAVALVILQRLAVNGEASKNAWQNACFDAWADKPSSNARSRAFSTAVRKMQAEGSITINGDIVSMSVSRNPAHNEAHT
ncbi:AAA family ATPase [Mesorhizobium sp. B2-4-14]|uniref:AAA family ATPase n=1 Tax=Mesorhizobium sp. B2-4-14 TaxID=2589935 RepID=UPI001127011D|nr:AAA family ATPase [Mesorhizobium sp. B2-4-14]TPK96299.1 AAA family ATPase [Mesorhizobium sp. B2-4-14]